MSKFDNMEFQRTFGTLPAWLSKEDNVSPPAERSAKSIASGAYRRAIGHFQRLRSDLATIDSDEDLSAKGKAKKKVEVVTEFKKQIDQIRNISVHKLREKRKSLTNTDKNLSDVEKMTASLRQAQILQHLPADPLANWQLAMTALDEGDIEVVEAIVGMPSVHPGRLGHEHLQEISQHLVEAKLRWSAPQKFTEYNELGEYIEVLDDTLATIAQDVAHIEQEIAGPRPTPAEFTEVVDETATETAEDNVSGDDSNDKAVTSGGVSDLVNQLIKVA